MAERYVIQLAAPEKQTALSELSRRLRQGPVALLYAARHPAHNNAVVLREVLAGMLEADSALL